MIKYSVEYWLNHFEYAMGYKDKLAIDTSNAEWTRANLTKIINGHFPHGFTGQNLSKALILYVMKYHPANIVEVSKLMIEYIKSVRKSPNHLQKIYGLFQDIIESNVNVDTFDSKIFDKISSVIDSTKGLLEIEAWNYFEIDFSIPIENGNEIYQDIKDNITNFSNVSGIYAIFNGEECLYIGKGAPIWQRIKSHYKASKGLDKNVRWTNFFKQYQIKLKVYWVEYQYLENKTLDDKLRELFEYTLQAKYGPIFNQFRN